jgi:hypothetical protein
MLNIRAVILSVMLVFMLVLAVWEAAVTGVAAPQTNVVNQSSIEQTDKLECASLPSRYSIHSVDTAQTGIRVIYSEDGPTGVDGGLIYLLSAYRTCSS